MALDPETLSRRVLAARMVAGYNEKRDQFSAQLAPTLNKHDVARWERAERDAPPVTPGKAHVLSKFTGLPPEWFLVEDLGQVFATSQNAEERLSQIEAVVKTLNETQASMLERLAELDVPDDSEQAPANAQRHAGQDREGTTK